MSAKVKPFYAQEISQRPPQTLFQRIHGLLCAFVFLLGCLFGNGTQFLLSPLLLLRLFPFPQASRVYTQAIRFTKGGFGTLLVLMTQWFGPTELRITFETEGLGKFTPEEVDNVAIRDGTGRITALRLPRKAVIISNHQVYVDWWYTWHLAYFMGTHKDIFIVLKKSLKWVPVLGWGMQFFRFIFLARSWESDRATMARRLAKLGQRAQDEDLPLSFVFFPEGTLVSKDTRPISKKFADKTGIPDMVHTLLPRSTGLQYVLRSLTPRIPELEVLDLTIAYPGVPPRGYGQSYYTIRSIFFMRVPPPAVHIHIRRFKAGDTPIGDVSASQPSATPSGNHGAVELEVPSEERDAFEQWVRALWREKDRMLDWYHEKGTFASKGQTVLCVPVKLKAAKDYLEAYCGFLPLWAWLAVSRMK